jgi:tRNA nucleotidyltransferase (CCA-adding enzyme)
MGMELPLPQTEYEMRKMLSKIGFDSVKAVLFIKKALFKIHIGKQLALLDSVKNDPVSIRQLAINGEDLKKIGINGEKIGETLKLLLNTVLENPKLNEKSVLLVLSNAPYTPFLQKQTEEC